MDATTQHSALARVRAVARLMDDVARVPGTNVRVGVDPVLSLLPVGGSALSALASLYIVLEAWRAGVSRLTLARMGVNLLADFAVGSLPIVGVFADALVRANRRNVELLTAHLEREDRRRWEREAVDIDLET